jgi:hypothetical protein
MIELCLLGTQALDAAAILSGRRNPFTVPRTILSVRQLNSRRFRVPFGVRFGWLNGRYPGSRYFRQGRQ